MADAKINLSLTPAEFDLVRETIKDRIELSNAQLKSKTVDARAKSKHRETVMRLNDLMRNLK